MLKDADGAPVANHNFHDVETTVRGAANLLQPAVGGPPEGLFLSIIDGIIPGPAEIGRTCLDLHEDEDLSLQDNEVEFIAAMAPVLGQNRCSSSDVSGRRVGQPNQRRKKFMHMANYEEIEVLFTTRRRQVLDLRNTPRLSLS